MPRRKPKPEKQVQQKIKESLDSILGDDDLDLKSLTSEDLPKIRSTEIMDFVDAKQTTGTEAKALLDKMVDFYLDGHYIDQSDHIEYKKKIDSMNLSSMMLQLKTAQHAIIKLLEEIDTGNTNPRLFEVLAQLQSQIMQMPKDHQAYIQKMEESYKTLKNDLVERKESGSFVIGKTGEDTINSPNGSIRVRGTKNLMENLRGILGSQIEDVTVEDLGEDAIVNARKKAEIDAKKGVKNSGDSDSGGYEIDDNMF